MLSSRPQDFSFLWLFFSLKKLFGMPRSKARMYENILSFAIGQATCGGEYVRPELTDCLAIGSGYVMIALALTMLLIYMTQSSSSSREGSQGKVHPQRCLCQRSISISDHYRMQHEW